MASAEDPVAPPVSVPARSFAGSGRSVLIAIPAALLAFGAWYLVQPKAAPEPEAPTQAAEPIVSADPVKRLEETVQQFPENLSARVDLAKLYSTRTI